ncbi:MAG: hypothetical protein AAFN04_14665 [Pseudomonadota bacterium]
MAEWVIGVVAIAFAVLVYVFGAIGSAALFFLWFPKMTRWTASLTASCLAPVLFVIVILLASFTQSPAQNDPIGFLVAMALVVAPGLIFGYPSAFLTLRALERRIERAGVKAQEIFE